MNQIPSFSNTLNIDLCLPNSAWLSLECKRKVANIVHQLETSREGPESFRTALFALIVSTRFTVWLHEKEGLVFRLTNHFTIQSGLLCPSAQWEKNCVRMCKQPKQTDIAPLLGATSHKGWEPLLSCHLTPSSLDKLTSYG